ncbi:MAG: hypothetical protein AB7G39_04150 [Alphaproteobacteria bacterium]
MADRVNAERIVARLSWGRRIAYAAISIAAGIALFLLMAEIACRILPVNDGLRAQPVNAENPVFRFEADRISTWSKGWNFSIVNTVRVNNDGFVNDNDYDPADRRPLLAVIGDSYIEAAMVHFPETVQGRLATVLGNRGRVYSFAASGAGLSQHLAWAAYARDKYRPQAFVFLNISNDFSESLYDREQSPGFHHFERMPDGTSQLRRVDYEPSRARSLLRHSALAMYLITNVKIQQILDFDVQNLGSNDRRWVANIDRSATDREYDDYRWAVRTYLDRLPAATGLPPDRIIIASDALRTAIYQPADRDDLFDSVWGRMRLYMAAEARARGFTVIDLQPSFEAAYARDGRRFEFPTDSHWNGHGHEMLAQAVMETEPFKAIFGAAAPR